MSNSPWDEDNFEHNKDYLMKKKKFWQDTEAQAKTIVGSLGENKMYSILLQDYLMCVNKYIQDFPMAPVMAQQLKRSDLDTVCAYELYQMKRHFVSTDVLSYSKFMKQE